MTTYYKATRPDGTDFRTGTVDYAAALASGETLTHGSLQSVKDDASTYFSVSVEPAETLIGGSWPCRLFRVEPVGSVLTSSQYPHKRAVHALRVVEELPAWQSLGPSGREVAAIIERAGRLTADDARRLGAAGYAARDAGWNAARDAAGYAARCAAGYAAWNAAGDAAGDAAGCAARDAERCAAGYAAWNAAGYAARGAARAYVVRDLIAPERFQTLAGPWLSVIGEPEVTS